MLAYNKVKKYNKKEVYNMINILLFLLISTIALQAKQPKIKIYVEPIPQNIKCVLGADIGGTKSNVGIFEVTDDKATLLISFHAKTKSIGDFNETMNELLQYLYDTYGITIDDACIAAPGVATKNKDYSKVHGMFDIKTSELIEKTPLKTAIIVNDLFVVGHGLDSIDQDNIVQLYGDIPEEKNEHDLRAIISAGTGIGSSTITWDSKNKKYITHAGEAGMLDFAPSNQLEQQFFTHIKNFYGRDTTYWANVASGSGITRIYSMLKLMGKHQDNLNLTDHNANVILKNTEDELCKATSDLFFKFFGRFARNYTWAILPYGGLYITGGIAANHSELFTEQFARKYEDPQFQKELRQIPVYLIKDPNVGLYGAVNYLLQEIKKTS
jgi:glucokinase